jgi:hypothetical protein
MIILIPTRHPPQRKRLLALLQMARHLTSIKFLGIDKLEQHFALVDEREDRCHGADLARHELVAALDVREERDGDQVEQNSHREEERGPKGPECLLCVVAIDVVLVVGIVVAAAGHEFVSVDADG